MLAEIYYMAPCFFVFIGVDETIYIYIYIYRCIKM